VITFFRKVAFYIFISDVAAGQGHYYAKLLMVYPLERKEKIGPFAIKRGELPGKKKMN
jgi:hypothetical protein